jgi:hypothetical protein
MRRRPKEYTLVVKFEHGPASSEVLDEFESDIMDDGQMGNQSWRCRIFRQQVPSLWRQFMKLH